MNSPELLSIVSLEIRYADRSSQGWQTRQIRAVDGVSLSLERGETLCLVGESGSGKTTLAQALLGLVQPSHGEIVFKGKDVLRMSRDERRAYRRAVQPVFQDPYESLNPRHRVSQILAEPLRVRTRRRERRGGFAEAICSALVEVGLEPPADFVSSYPHELSGGQRQRVAIAAALSVRPEVLIADEPVSMLDVSVRAGILQLVQSLKAIHELSVLFITHDLSVAWAIGDRTAVMYAGRIVEIGETAVVAHPQHPYTMALLAAVSGAPRAVAHQEAARYSEAEPVSEAAVGCRYRSRCPYALRVCQEVTPGLREVKVDHWAACHRSEEIESELREAKGPTLDNGMAGSDLDV